MSLSLHLLPPPYSAVSHQISLSNLSDESISLGALLAFRLDDLDKDFAALRTSIKIVRRKQPSVPFVLWPAFQDDTDLLGAAMKARHLGVRAVITASAPRATSLRRQLTDTPELVTDLLRWLSETRFLNDSSALGLLRRVFVVAERHRTVRSTARAMNVSSRALQQSFARKGLAPPRRFITFLASLKGALAIQSSPNTALQDLAYSLNYANGEAMRKVIKRTFFMTPREVRDILGFEPLLARWIQNTVITRT